MTLNILLFRILWKLKLLFDSWLLHARIITRDPRLIFDAPAPMPPLTFTEVLYPRLNRSGGGWTGGGFYTFILNAASGGPGSAFFNLNAIQAGGYIGNSELQPGTNLDIYGVPAMSAFSCNGATTMASKIIEWQNVPAGGGVTMYMWNKKTGPCGNSTATQTVTFIDVNGFAAWYSPVLVALPSPGTGFDIYCPTLVAAFVSSDGFTCKIRLTRAHAATGHINTTAPNGHLTMTWTHDAAGGVADPADPTNTNKCIVTLPPGNYIFAVQANYFNDLTHQQYDCYSEQSMAVTIT